MGKMDLLEWIKEHRKELDRYISRAIGGPSLKTDRERRLWVLNDERLYLWARAEGVDL